MGVRIKFDSMNNIRRPTLILATRKGKKLGSIPAYNIVFKDNLNSYSELSFRLNKYDNQEECRLWNQVKDFKLIYCREWDLWFEIYVEIDESNELIKNVIGKTISEAELSQINLYDIEINTEIDISRDDYEEPTVFYNNEYPENSLLNRITEKAPHYEITHVDSSLMNIQKTFSFDDISIYDAFQEIAEEVGCLFVFDSGATPSGGIKRTIAVYDLNTNCNNCGYRGEYIDICPECGGTDLDYGYGNDTKIFISSENLADEITYSIDTDSVKNCFKVEGGDDLINATVRNCNPNGTDYIWYISDDVKEDMSDELVKKIKDYDELYRYYSNKCEISLNADSLDKYNDLVKKYGGYNEDLKKIDSDSPIIGYPELMNAYYNTIDLSVFLQSALMPSPTDSETSADEQAALLTKTNLSPVAVINIDTLSDTTAENAVLAAARTLVKPGYQVKVNNSSLSGTTWTGNFTVTNYYNEDDTEVSGVIDVTINDDMETYINQKIEKALYNNETDNLSITGLFKLDYSDFCNELKKYCLDSLLIFNDAGQSALDILIEQGIAADSSSDIYTKLYYPYYEKLEAIQGEISLREDEIEDIIGKYDSNGDLVKYGLQNYIIDIRDAIQSDLDFEEKLGTENWLEFCSYRRDDKFLNSNYISDGLDNAELFKKALELLEAATKEIYKSAELQHTISSSLKNLLAIEEFQPLLDNFEVGNWIRMRVDNDVYKLRLLTYEIDYDDLSKIFVEFSDVLKTVSGLSDVQSIFKQASSMATSYDSVIHQASQGSSGNKRLSEWVEKGLSLTNMKIISGSDNQEITWDNHGFLMKEYFPVTDTFSDKQLKIINKGLYVTDDAWKTSRAGIGNFVYYDPRTTKTKEGYGVIADTLIGNLILGEEVGIYTSKNDITLNKDGLIITNENDNSISKHITITMNPDPKNDPNNNSGVFSIKSKITRETNEGVTEEVTKMIMQVTGDGKLIVGDSNFVVDTDGTAHINNIVMGGNITWNADSNPVKVLYAASDLSAPSNAYNSYPSNSSSDWHKTYDSSSDYFASYSYDSGKTWGKAVKIRGTDGEPGADGANGEIDYDTLYDLLAGSYQIERTEIGSALIRTPTLQSGTIAGGIIIGGTLIAAGNNVTDFDAAAQNDRIVIEGNTITTYNEEGKRNGVSIYADSKAALEAANTFGAMLFYYEDRLQGGLYATESSVMLRPIGEDCSLTLGKSGRSTYAHGRWFFSSAEGVTVAFA
ncbi:MAG: hypothetical protein Q4G33_11575 [bacterium]|nr:hypothetical protein [bacterium]